MNKKYEETELLKLRELVETYGSDQRRWPASARIRFSRIVATDDSAERLIREHRALEHVIEGAQRRDEVAALALGERIIADAQDMETRASRESYDYRMPYRTMRKYRYVDLAAAAVLVLVIFGAGFSIGISGWAGPAVQQLAGIDADLDNDDPLFSEDIL